MKCPQCGGSVLTSWGEKTCLACGWAPGSRIPVIVAAPPDPLERCPTCDARFTVSSMGNHRYQAHVAVRKPPKRSPDDMVSGDAPTPRKEWGI